jgi:uncharacterized coiled-coil protein SlyX
MSVQKTIVDGVNQAFAKQDRETTLPTLELKRMFEEGERQLEGLFDRIKAAERQVIILEDRVEAQRDTIKRLEGSLAEAQTKKVDFNF